VLIAEDLLLLLLDDTAGTIHSEVKQVAPTALAAALLGELQLIGAVEFGPSSANSSSMVVKQRITDVEDQLLIEALDVVDDKPRSVMSLLHHFMMKLGPQTRLSNRLAERGILEHTTERSMLVFSKSRWPAKSIAHETQVRKRIGQVLFAGAAPDPRTAMLISLLARIEHLERMFRHPDVPAQVVADRAGFVGDAGWVSQEFSKLLPVVHKGQV